MRYIKPSFYDNFKCIAERCTDSCCIGWEIDVDDETYDKYDALDGETGGKIRGFLTVSPDGSRCFRLTENERCPFLDKSGLCDIITNIGESYLCEICREHPRFYEWVGDNTECGLGLCCEEACGLLLFGSGEFSLVCEDDGEICDEIREENELYEEFFALRQTLFVLAVDDSISLAEREE